MGLRTSLGLKKPTKKRKKQLKARTWAPAQVSAPPPPLLVARPPIVETVKATAPILVDLQQEHLKDASLFATRCDALSCWPHGARIAEIGVAFGSFTSQILERTAPEVFDAYDLFTLHEIETLWGKPSAEIFAGKKQRQYYEDKFSIAIAAGRLRLFEGDSSTEIAKRGAAFYDAIYVDGDHSENGVVRDTRESISVLKSEGMLVFNDYVLYDKRGAKYGVVPVVNDLCANHGWRAKYLALQKEMFCDIALVRPAAA